MKVLAAMSGGVDSAVAAARAVDEGHEVVGVHLALSKDPAAGRTGSRGCCSIEDADDARRAADVLGIPFYVWDLSDRFAEAVVDDFAASYAAGETPNPCIRCNERIKFSALLDRALALGFDRVATGHYARREDAGDGVALHRAGDPLKDQSYVLATVRRDRLARAMFPLGGVAAKDEVRAEAAARGLPVAAKPDSHDICFIPDGDTGGWLDRRLGAAPGTVLDTSGRGIGTHAGVHRFTVGQRRGLHLDRPAPDGRPRYVLSIHPVDRTVVVGGAEDLLVDRLAGSGPSWLAPRPVAGERMSVQVRAHGDEIPVTVHEVAETFVRFRTDVPVPAVAAGQTIVMYQDDRVVGAVTATARH